MLFHENSDLEAIGIYQNKRTTGIATNYGVSIDASRTHNVVIVRLYGRLSGMTAGTDTTIATLTADYRPIYNTGWNTYVDQSAEYMPFLASINVNGEVHINCAGGAVPSGYINVTYTYGV